MPTEARLQHILNSIARVAKPPSSHGWTRGVPYPQPYHIYSTEHDTWLPLTPNLSTTLRGVSAFNDRFTVLSWNIDFMRILPDQRMRRAVDWLKEYIDGQITNSSVVIMLNEMLESDLAILKGEEWVRMGYYLTDIGSGFWESGYYGTCMLLPRTFKIANVFRIHYTKTNMDRDALMVDLTCPNDRTVRLCCTHLESLIAKPPRRPIQISEAAKSMKEAGIFGAMLAGDLNAIEEFDRTLHSDNGLKDAYLESGGIEGDEKGMTWGQMAPTKERQRFGLTRMDKIMYCGGLNVDKFEYFGMDVCVEDENLVKELIEEEGLEKGWVTDHLGVRADFVVDKRKG